MSTGVVPDVRADGGTGPPTAPAKDAVALEGVTKRYGDVVAVMDLTLRVAAGEFLTLLGPSGCGKTTSLRMIGGFETPDSGAIRIDEVDMAHRPPYKRPVNTVFQQYALFPHLSVRDNIAYGLRHGRQDRSAIRGRVEEMMDLMQIPELGDRRPRQLSGGQQQRVALARALVMNPKVLLLDEPLGSLDYKLRKAMQFELRRIHREVGVTFIYVTHDQEEAMTMSDRIVILNRGRIEQDGSPKEIFDEPASAFVADFIGDTNLLEGTVTEARDGHARVDLGPLGEAVGAAAQAVSAGALAKVSVRPTDLRVESADGSAAIIEDAVLVGGHVAMTIRSGERMITAHVTRDQALAPGTAVQLHFDSDRIRIFAGDAE
jgi:spermidine/putrescine transport system ATP-binding protein